MTDRPFQDLGSREIVTLAKAAQRRGEPGVVEAARRELAGRASAAARKALAALPAATAVPRTPIGKPVPRVDAKAPCLYAIKLRKNAKGATLYVGMSSTHSAACKASIHLKGVCTCGATAAPNIYQRRPVPRDHGIGLVAAKAMPAGMDVGVLEDAEEAWAQELADRGEVVWCNGTAFRRAEARRSRAKPSSRKSR